MSDEHTRVRVSGDFSSRRPDLEDSVSAVYQNVAAAFNHVVSQLSVTYGF